MTLCLSSPACSPQDRKWPKEGLLCLSHLSIYPFTTICLFWVCYSGCQVHTRPWKSRGKKKKKNPAFQKPTDSRISASLSPGPGDTARPHSARDGGNPVPVL